MNDDSFRLTPADVRGQEFRRRMFGYDRAGVEDFRQRLAEELERMWRERTQMEERLENFREQLRAFRERERALNEAVVMAQQMRDETEKVAKRNSEVTLQEARVRADEDKPFIALLVNLREMARKRYNPSQHDPIIAHEATHPLLESRGLAAIALDNQPNDVHWAINSIHNWLADPVINRLIYDRGFNIASDRIAEIRQSISGLRSGKWVGKPIEGSVRLAVSFLLEPNVPSDLQRKFLEAFGQSTSRAAEGYVKAIIDIVNGKRVEQPRGYRSAAKLLANYLSRFMGVPLSPLTFASPPRSFSADEIAEWKSENITSTMKWP